LTYQPDARHRNKHKWDRDEPAIEEDDDGKPVGRCPERIDGNLAQSLLDGGIKWPGRKRRSPFVERVFNVFEGVPYRGKHIGGGRYAGFPELPDRIPPGVKEELFQRACAEGYGQVFSDWMDAYGERR